MDARRWDRLSLGVTNGLKAWLWYGVAEYVLCSIVPVLFWPYAVVATAQWRATAELLACYGIIGATLGVGSALSVDRHGRLSLAEFSRRSQALLILTVIVAFSVNLATTPEVPERLTAILTVLIIGGAVFWSVWRIETDHFSGSPAVVSAIL